MDVEAVFKPSPSRVARRARPLARTISLAVGLVLGIVATADGPLAALGAAHTTLDAGIVTLLAPAHGTAFAFGQPGHLLTSRHAVTNLSSVRLVTNDGRTETATVVATSNASIVQLRGPLVLPRLHGGRDTGPGTTLELISGPLNGSHTRYGTLSSRSGRTSVPSAPALDGAPALDRNGAVIGVASAAGGHVIVNSAAGLRAAATPTASAAAGSGTLIVVLAAIFVFGAGVGSARILVRSRVSRRLAARRSGHAQPRPPLAPPARSRPTGSEADTGVHVILREREPEEPPPDVRLRSHSPSPTRRRHSTGERESSP